MLKLWKAAALALALAICFAAGWFGHLVWDHGLTKAIGVHHEPFLAKDNSGHHGFVVNECRDQVTKEPTYYDLQLDDGKIIKVPAKSLEFTGP